MRRFLALTCTALLAIAFHARAAEETAAPVSPGAIDNLLTESSQRLADGDYEGAIRDASLALQLDPKNAAAYEARGSIYIQERLWDRAERDYASAAKFSPDVVYKYKLAQIAFYKKTYEDASSRFAALESDPNLGDLAYYQSFLCDLLGGHDAKAAHVLAARDQMPPGPSLYFCHAAWDLYHEDHPGASKAFAAASHLYDQTTCERYISSLIETRRFQLASATFTDRDGNAYTNASIFLESGGLRVSTKKGWITLTLDQLPDDLSAFPVDMREQIDRRRAVRTAAVPPAPESVLTFTTQAGKHYDQVHWSLQAGALAVLTPDGWIALAFADLPTDLSTFPPELRQVISEKRKALPSPAVKPAPISFTTKQGKLFSDVKVLLDREGVQVLTEDGWIAIPFRDLPEDLSPFPPEWKESIVEGRQSTAADATGMRVVSFTTRAGVHYDQVRAAMEKSGLRVLTPDGLIAVPYSQLPTDCSVFPEEWRETIAAKEIEALTAKPSPDHSTNLIYFK
jgi:hypothetical protein